MTAPAIYQEQQYLDILKDILENGRVKGDRTNTGTISRTGAMMRFDLTGGEFPLFTHRKFNSYPIITELDWFVEGSSNVWDLIKMGCNIWDQWMDHDKNFGLNIKERPLVKVQPKEYLSLEEHFANENLEIHYKRCMSHVPMVRRDYDEDALPLVDKILKYWEELFMGTMYNLRPDNSTFVKSSVLARSGCIGLDPELHVPSVFVKTVLKADNFKAWIDDVLSSSIYISKYHLTGIYFGGNIISMDAKFLHQDEIADYQSDSIYKVTFEEYPHGTRPPMYLYNKGQLKTHIDDITRIEVFSRVKGLPKGKLLRYTTGKGELGPVYGKQWRKQLTAAVKDNTYTVFENDQLAKAMNDLKNNPESRRIIVDSWNPGEVPDMKLPPCHLYFQFTAAPIDPVDARRILSKITDEIPSEMPKYIVDITYFMRSNDMPVGQPFNTPSYAALLLKVCAKLNMVPGDVIYQGADAHIYQNQIPQVKKILKREPLPAPKFKVLNWGAEELSDVEIQIEGYEHHPAITMPVAV